MPAAQFARTVVAEVTKATPRQDIWVGAHVIDDWIVDTCLPRTLIDRVVADMYGMLKLAARMRGAEGKNTSNT
ncbi:hypothetical protein B0H14DRAFT_3457346 [Mycena olivaceomarginata]|nr:hypothetical protein B0H14DRAFT_3457346 [Mycena olivaceomarginata]